MYAASLRQSDLRGADISYSDLREILLCGANLQDANLRGANLAGACYDQDTIWPAGFDPGRARARFLEWDKQAASIPEDFCWCGSLAELRRVIEEEKRKNIIAQQGAPG
jgi:hypothetical protein